MCKLTGLLTDLLTGLASELGKLGSKEKEQNWNEIAFSNMCYKVFMKRFDLNSLFCRIAACSSHLTCTSSAQFTSRRWRCFDAPKTPFWFHEFPPYFCSLNFYESFTKPKQFKTYSPRFSLAIRMTFAGNGFAQSTEEFIWLRPLMTVENILISKKGLMLFFALFPLWKFEYWMIWPYGPTLPYGCMEMERSLREWDFSWP